MPRRAKFIEEAQCRAARVREQETQKAIAAAEQIMTKAREAAARNTSACSPNSNARSAGWWCRLPPR